MKKSLLILMTAITLGLFVTSCSKEDSNPPANSTAEGTWTGTGQYGTSGGNPTYAFTIKFNAGGTVNITGDNSTAIDVATGTWQMVADSVKATYKYASSSAIYKLSGKFSASSNVMAGTIGLDPVSAGVGIFSVTRTQ